PPVHAPAAPPGAFCAPGRAGGCSPRMPAPVVVAVTDGITKGCTAGSVAPARWSRRPSAQARASAIVLVIFQLVPIQRRDMSLLRREGCAGGLIDVPCHLSGTGRRSTCAGPWESRAPGGGRRAGPCRGEGPAPPGQ